MCVCIWNLSCVTRLAISRCHDVLWLKIRAGDMREKGRFVSEGRASLSLSLSVCFSEALGSLIIVAKSTGKQLQEKHRQTERWRGEREERGGWRWERERWKATVRRRRGGVMSSEGVRLWGGFEAWETEGTRRASTTDSCLHGGNANTWEGENRREKMKWERRYK